MIIYWSDKGKLKKGNVSVTTTKNQHIIIYNTWTKIENIYREIQVP